MLDAATLFALFGLDSNTTQGLQEGLQRCVFCVEVLSVYSRRRLCVQQAHSNMAVLCRMPLFSLEYDDLHLEADVMVLDGVGVKDSCL